MTLGSWEANYGERVICILTIASSIPCRWLDVAVPNYPATDSSTWSAPFGLQSGPTHRALADAFCVKDLWIGLQGPAMLAAILVAYPIHDPQEGSPPPHGWSLLDRAIATGQSVWITYEGGTRGISPRSITPRRFQQRGGVAYVVAYCHLDFLEKSFRLDRIRHCEVLEASEPCGHHVDPETMNR